MRRPLEVARFQVDGRRSLPTSPDGAAAHARSAARAPALSSVSPDRSGRLPPAHGATAAPVPSIALLVAAGGALAIAVVAVAVTVRSDKTVEALEGPLPSAPAASPALAPASPEPTVVPAAPRSDRARPDELDAAKTVGLAALGGLAQRYPDDPDVLRALMLAHGKDREGHAAALGVARRLFAIAPDAARDAAVRTLLLMAANGKPEVSAIALDLMTGHMGSTGPDLLFELTTAPGIGKVPRDRADAQLRDPAVRSVATAALRIANELRIASPCNRKALFARAGQEGDGRSLGYLRPLLITNSCSSGGLFGRVLRSKADCFACLGDRASLRTAIEAIERRSER